MINHYRLQWIEEWCAENGWTDLFMSGRNEFWAFPPHAVMPLPIPKQVLQLIKQQKGMSLDEQRLGLVSVAVTAVAAALTYWMQSPMPLVSAFMFCAIVVTQLEMDD
ncbi:MAG: hypothetical protein MUF49_01315 [Oculatellaceae cyanobacterium Prado106]|jgi:hypothetical protein|nr:hypothetical protein [Oculatellaceae cyanobacterium Prado106]